MPSASYSFLRGKNNYSPHLSLTVPDIIRVQNSDPRTLPLFCTQFRDPASAIINQPGLNIDLRKPAVCDDPHMVLLTKDSLETRSAQTLTQIRVYIHLYTLYASINRINQR